MHRALHVGENVLSQYDVGMLMQTIIYFLTLQCKIQYRWCCNSQCGISAILETICMHCHAPWDNFNCRQFLTSCFFRVFFFFFYNCKDGTFLNFAKVFFFFFHVCPSLRSVCIPILKVYILLIFGRSKSVLTSPIYQLIVKLFLLFLIMAWSYLCFPSLPSTSFLSISICWNCVVSEMLSCNT